ncbi:cyclin-like protein [Tribonema minus]|uniref:B-related factor 1 n=1 Tax=Tribonema minus TaxID=303371 RepID=A0A836CKB6_9STRA|nr:cyclin-like protein [Tribonema minus]
MSGWRCKEEGCGGTRLESDAAGGSTYCSTCGAVYDENTLVNSVEFSESAGGAAAVVGTFVSAAGTKAYPLAAGSRGMAGDRDSREASIQAAHGKIKMIATQLRMSLKYAEAAHRLFRAAVTNRFVQGRKTVNVIAACLFIVARQNRLPMMLLDISDAVRVNVFELGQTFLRLFRILSLQTNMHIVDPSLLINKYVERLNLGVKKNVIQEVAANITAQMNRDWIHTGRRPAGICAVALQIACNVHGVGITRKQICRILRISDSTISKRMREFEQTPASLMAQFDRAKGDRGAMPEADPPSFVNNRQERC